MMFLAVPYVLGLALCSLGVSATASSSCSLGNMCLAREAQDMWGSTRDHALPSLQELRQEISNLEEQLSLSQEGPEE